MFLNLSVLIMAIIINFGEPFIAQTINNHEVTDREAIDWYFSQFGMPSSESEQFKVRQAIINHRKERFEGMGMTCEGWLMSYPAMCGKWKG